MRRTTKLVLLTVVAFVLGGWPSNIMGGRGTSGGGGGGISGVEKACTDSGLYGSGGNCLGSEMFDENNSSITDNEDFASSPDTHELAGNRSGVQPFGTDGDNQTVDVSSATGWGNQSWAYEVDNGSTNWMRFPVSLVTASTRTICMRYYMEVDATYAGAGSDTGACTSGQNWRNKLFQWNYAGLCSGGNNAGLVCTSQSFCQPGGGSCAVKVYQAEEQSDGSCPASGTHRPIDFYSPEGTRRTALNAGNPARLSMCNDGPCRFEFCLDGNIQAGTNITARMRVYSTETGLTYDAEDTSAESFVAGIAAADFNGGDWWHSGNLGGTERSRRALFTAFAWNADADNWIGAACEIEGGC